MRKAAPNRRTILKGGAAGLVALAAPPVLGQAPQRIVVIGGGFAGATCARWLKQEAGKFAVTLIEPNNRFAACPFSNAVIAGLRPIEAQYFSYDGVKKSGVEIAEQIVVAIDWDASQVRLADGRSLDYQRIVLAPGIDLRFDALPGYDQPAAEIMPHAWKAGAQTVLLRQQLEAMADGGVVVMSAPANPFRCPPGPYERASLIAHYLKARKPRSKLILLDAKDTFSKQKLFQAAWQDLYPGLIEWVPLSQGGRVTEVDPASKTLITEFGSHRADVANVIPPQRAGAIAVSAGVADQTGWCPIDPLTFESKLRPDVHVIGDAAIAGAMPKSAFAANAQAKVAAQMIAGLMRGEEVHEVKLINTCYSLVAPDYGISVAGVYSPKDGLLTEIKGAGGVSPLEAKPAQRAVEAAYAEAWFQTITGEVFG
ncbi:FCSD flavin-binding domain-containing protein [Taklimakanibacter deserti]|uniref:FCSD flavin-binding domain-containing protein n=1 Tax=Taklimakanibacter deserti TaxID=2267839 RepID=UPI0034D451F3